MKRPLCALLFVAASLAAQTTLQGVTIQGVAIVPSSRANTGFTLRQTTSGGLVVSLAAYPTQGDVVVACIGFLDSTSTAPTLTVADENSNSYTVLSVSGTYGSTAGFAWIAYLLNAPANAGKTITATFSKSATNYGVGVLDFALPAGFTTATVDSSANGSGTGTAINTPSLTPSAAGDLLYSYMMTSGTNVTSTGTWTAGSFAPVNTGQWMDAYILKSSSSPTAPNYTAGSGNYDSVSIAIKPN